MNKFGNKLFNYFGMSITEVLIASAMASGLALVIAQLSKDGTNVGKRLESKSDAAVIRGLVEGALGHPTGCLQTLSSVVTNGNHATNLGVIGTAVTDIKNHTMNTILTNTSKRGSVTITSIMYHSYSTTTQQAILSIKGNFKLNKLIQPIKNIDIPLNVSLNASNNLISCVAATSGNGSDLWQPMIGGPIGIFYNSGSVSIGSNTSVDTMGSTPAFAIGTSNVVSGNNSSALGSNNILTGSNSGTIGGNSTISGNNTFVIGSGDASYPNLVAANNSFVGGTDNIVGTNAHYSISFGVTNRTNAYQSMVFGGNNTTVDGGGVRSILLGHYLTSSNSNNITLGDGNTTVLNNSIQNGFAARFSGGYRFFNNAGMTQSFKVNDNGSISSGTSTASSPLGIALGDLSLASGSLSGVAMGRSCNASGNMSAVCFGYYATASGDSSFATQSSTASNTYAFAGGGGSIASGMSSFAFGFNSTASNTASALTSFAFGDSNTASGQASFAMGENNVASGQDSFALGNKATASGKASFAMGMGKVMGRSTRYPLAQGEGSVSMGIANIASGEASTSLGFGNFAYGKYTTSIGYINRAGSSTFPDNATVGSMALAMGSYNLATGFNSVAIGFQNESTGDYSVSIGDGGFSSGLSSVCIKCTNASTERSLAMGLGTASGIDSVAIGMGSTASSSRAIAIGGASVSGQKAIGLGANNGGTTADGNFSFAVGHNATTNVGASMGMAIGTNTTAAHPNSLVLAQSPWATVQSSADNKMTIMAAGGIEFCDLAAPTCSNGRTALWSGGAWSYPSDKNLKEDFQNVDEFLVLKKLEGLDITTWIFKQGKDRKKVRNIGPMAQDFYHLFAKPFKLHSSEKMIATDEVFMFGIVGIKGLIKKSNLLQKENDILKDKLSYLEKKLQFIEERLLKKK